MAKEKPVQCPECGGRTKGRGYLHVSGCSKAARVVKPAVKDDFAIDGRTRISVLLQLQARIERILAEKDQREVKKVKEALANVEKLRQQLKEAEALIG